MSYRNRSKSEQQTVLRAIVFAVAVGLVLITPTSINFQLALAQEEQGTTATIRFQQYNVIYTNYRS